MLTAEREMKVRYLPGPVAIRTPESALRSIAR
jgi:hypothetical protein